MDNIFKLIKKQFNGALTPNEEQELQAWYNNNANNQRTYTCYYATLKLFRIKQKEKHFTARVIPAYNRIYKITRQKEYTINRKHSIAWIGYVAIVLLAFGVGYLLKSTGENSWDNSMQSIEIAYGSKSLVTLPDGTQVWLNSGSKLEYPGSFGRSNRNVTLKGEAYFEVSKNKELPFRVSSGKIAIHVLGTKFNMKAYPEDEKAKITLVEGSLAIENNKNSKANILLKPNQQAVINQKSERTQVRNVIASNYVMWTTSHSKSAALSPTDNAKAPAATCLPKAAARNILFFDEEPLSQIVKDLERAFNVHIVIEDKTLREKHFYGDFCNEETITDILKIIAEKNSLYYTIKGDTIQIMKKNEIRNRVN